MSHEERVARLLTRAYPAALRREYGDEIVAALRAGAAERHGPLARGRYWLRSALDLTLAGLRLRLGGSLAPPPPPRRRRLPQTPRESRLDVLLTDLVAAWRGLRASPRHALLGFSLLAVALTAAVAVFGMVDVALLRPLPYREADRIVGVHSSVPRFGIDFGQVSRDDWEDLRAASTSLQDVTLWGYRSWDLATDGRAERMPGAIVSANFFDVLGVTPLLGRTFARGEDAPGTDLVVISEGAWRSVLGGDPAIVGRRVLLDGEEHEIIGVVPETTVYPDGRRVWKASVSPAGSEPRSRRVYLALGRLRPGATLEMLRADLTDLASHLETTYPDSNRGIGMAALGFRDERVGRFDETLTLLAAGVAFLLLIVCINVTNLGLARATRRSRELAVRAALGAGRGRLVRQVLLESALVSAAAALVALWAGPRLAAAFLATLLRNVPAIYDVSTGAFIVGFTLAIAALAALGSGLLPALRAGGGDLGSVMKEGDRTSSVPASQRRTLSALVALEVALSCVLLVGAGLALHSFLGLAAVDPGFDPENVATISLQPPQARYDAAERWRLLQRVEERLEGLPGVEAVGAGALLPLVGNGNVNVQGDLQSEDEARANPPMELSPITPGYLDALSIPLLRGRDFTDADDADAERVVIVSAVAAERLWPGLDPIGRRLRQPEGEWLTVVGVAGDVHQIALRHAPGMQMYLPYPQEPWVGMAIVLRSDGAPERWLATMRQVSAEVDPLLAPYNVATLTEVTERSIVVERLLAMQGWALSALAVLLAAVGLYGVVSYVAGQRVHEFGIRLACGADGRDLARLVMRDALRVVAVGLAVGLGVALVLSRSLSGALYGVTGFEPAVYAGVLLLLGGAASLAAILPARRAAALDPIRALREP